MTHFFISLFEGAFKSDEDWHLFYCDTDSTLGCRVIQDKMI